jgi:hypothetical protein
MEKCGFVFTGHGLIEDGMQTIRYELTSESFRQATARDVASPPLSQGRHAF